MNILSIEQLFIPYYKSDGITSLYYPIVDDPPIFLMIECFETDPLHTTELYSILKPSFYADIKSVITLAKYENRFQSQVLRFQLPSPI